MMMMMMMVMMMMKMMVMMIDDDDDDDDDDGIEGLHGRRRSQKKKNLLLCTPVVGRLTTHHACNDGGMIPLFGNFVFRMTGGAPQPQTRRKYTHTPFFSLSVRFSSCT